MKIINKIAFFCLLIFFVILAPFFVHADENDSIGDYKKAVENYYNKKFEEALNVFLKLAENKSDNGYLYYDLGNTYYKLGKLGAAIQYYEKALRSIPRDSDLKTNLKMVRSKLLDKPEESFSDYLISTLFFWSSSVSLYEFQMFLVILSLLFWGYAFFKLLRKTPFFKVNFIFFVVIFVYFLGGYYLKSHLYEAGSFGVILSPEVDVKANYIDKDKPLFQLHEGTKVRIIDAQDFGEKEKWFRVEMPLGQKGWVSSQVIGII